MISLEELVPEDYLIRKVDKVNVYSCMHHYPVKRTVQQRAIL